jgi:hypothetical protein
VKTYKLTETQKKLAEAEVKSLVFALSVDHQWGIRELCYLLEILELPKRLNRERQFEELEKAFALYREKTGFGRVWTVRQINQAFYAGTQQFRRSVPRPISRAEARLYGQSEYTKAVPAEIRRLPRKPIRVKTGGEGLDD